MYVMLLNKVNRLFSVGGTIKHQGSQGTNSPFPFVQSKPPYCFCRKPGERPWSEELQKYKFVQDTAPEYEGNIHAENENPREKELKSSAPNTWSLNAECKGLMNKNNPFCSEAISMHVSNMIQNHKQ